jgi:hypothetical protein
MPTTLTSGNVGNRCLAVMSRSVQEGNTPEATLAMRSEILEIAREASHWNLGCETKARLLLRPMEEALVDRYGSHLGRRLYWDFVEGFWITSFSGSSADRPEQHRPIVWAEECQMQC